MCQDQQADAEGHKSGRPKNWTWSEGHKTKVWRTAHDTAYCQTESQEWRFLGRNHHQTTSGPPKSRNRLLHTKNRAFKCLQALMWTGGVLQSIIGAFIKWLPCCTIDPLGRTSKNKSTPMICTGCCTPGVISSLLSIISSQAASIKPLLVSRYTKQKEW